MTEMGGATHGLPDGWTMAELADIADCRLGKMLDQQKNLGDLRPYLRNTNVQWGRIDLDDIKKMRIEDDERDRFAVLPGDLLVCEGGEPGRSAVWREDREIYCQKALHRVRPRHGVSAEYIGWWLRHATTSGGLEDLFTGSTIKHLPGRQLARIPIPVPPAEEQQRIAERLDEVECRRAFVAARLNAAWTTLGRLRDAILAAACSGRLTDDWRAQNPDVPTVDSALADKAARATRRRSNGTQIDLSLPDLPATYVVTTVGAAAELVEYGTSKRCDATADAGVPVLRMGNIQDGRLDPTDLKYCERDSEIERLLLADGDLLFNRTNSPELVGKTAVFRYDVATSFASYLIRVRFWSDIANPDYVNLWMNSAYGRMWARLAKTDGVSQSNINGTKLALMPIPLPPMAEQIEIVRRATRAVAAADRLSTQIAAIAALLSRTSRAALTRAFRGELVPSEASITAEEGRPFESADELIARVRQIQSRGGTGRRSASA